MTRRAMVSEIGWYIFTGRWRGVVSPRGTYQLDVAERKGLCLKMQSGVGRCPSAPFKQKRGACVPETVLLWMSIWAPIPASRSFAAILDGAIGA